MFSFCSHEPRRRGRPAVHARPAGAATRPRAYFRVDELLRELENPNLHDIANMQSRVELWTADGQHVRWVVAATANITIGHAAFDAAVANWPNERFTLRQGVLLIREHPERARR